MAIFDFLKKSEEKKRPVDKTLIANIKSVRVLGAGCKNCHIQYENVKKALNAIAYPLELSLLLIWKKLRNTAL